MTDPAQLYAQAVAAFNQRDWRLTRSLAARLLPLAKDHAGLHYIAGIASLEMQDLGAAGPLLRKACSLDPANGTFAAHYAKVLSMVRLSSESLAAADKAMALSPGDATTLDTLGVVYSQAGAYARAAEAFRRAVSLAPSLAHYRFNLATSLIYDGQIDEAEQELEACLQCEPRFWRAHLTLAHLRKQTPSTQHLDRLTRLLPQVDGDPTGQMNLHLAMAKECEDLGDYAEAFEHYVQGKTAGRGARAYSIERDEAIVDALIRAFPEPEHGLPGDPSDEPIFVIGMPRSGTTLVDRILSSHPDVHSAGELQDFGVVLKLASGSRTSMLLDVETIERSARLDWQAVGRDYLASTRPGTGATRHFIDKLPHNFLYAGFIARALPNAKIVCLRRDPMDTCLSNFRQLFALTSSYHDYSFDLRDTGHYYVLFDRLIAHWQRVLPGRIFEIDYETLVDAQEPTSRALLSHCGLPWHDACLRFEENQAPVTTASALQVRNPIYRTSIRRWKRYESQLEELKGLLLASGIRVEQG